MAKTPFIFNTSETYTYTAGPFIYKKIF